MEKIKAMDQIKSTLEGIGYPYSIDYCQRFGGKGCLENHIELTVVLEEKNDVMELINRIDFDVIHSRGNGFILKKYEPCAKLKSKPVKADFVEKEVFVNILDKIVKQIEFDKDFSSKLQDLFPEDRIYIGYDNSNAIDAAIKALGELTGDQETDWISYWLWELNCGESYEIGYVTKDGKDIPLKTPEDLYNMLKEDYENDN